MAQKKDPGHIKGLLDKANRVIDGGIKGADQVLDDAVALGTLAAGKAKKTREELHRRAGEQSGGPEAKGARSGAVPPRGAAAGASGDLLALEQLDRLRRAGTITEKEFLQKKKEILGRI